MKQTNFIRIEQEFIDSSGHLRLSLQEFVDYFKLSSDEGERIFNDLKALEHFSLKGEYEREQEEPTLRLTIDPFYAWIKNNLNEKESQFLF